MKGANTLLREKYWRLRYELDQILPDAILRIGTGHYIHAPYYRVYTEVEYLGFEEK